MLEDCDGAAPQMPALAFSLAMLARFGPLGAPPVFWIPALALALDQSDPKASPDGFEAAGFVPVDEVDVVDVNDAVDCTPGLAFAVPEGG
jgi:hypothetical protein